MYDFVVYTLQEEIEADLPSLTPNWMDSKESIFLRSQLNHAKETLYFLTQNDLWMKSLDELQCMLKTYGTLDEPVKDEQT